nr:immunoglobulin heavy chain junction region [Mus musculus]MBK4190068.1 immunoglobulin heavy chain junction region [Mus musculus]MBK4190070.1 immunoglobulin heavy chain junction region [Mus musculus]
CARNLGSGRVYFDYW